MKKTKSVKPIIIILFVFLVSAIVSGVLYSLYYEAPPAYRPMIFYDGNLLWDEKIADIDIEKLEYVGTVNSRVSESEKPDSELECNAEVFMNGELYRDDDGNYYVYCSNGNLLLLHCCL